MFEYIVKERPICAHCGKKCGARDRPWPIQQTEQSPWDGAHDRYLKHCAKVEEQRKADFRKRACEALRINEDDNSELVDRVVAAMEWAQTQ